MKKNDPTKRDRLKKQKVTLLLFLGILAVLFIALLIFLFSGEGKKEPTPLKRPSQVSVVSEDINHDNLRIAELEKKGDHQSSEMEYLKSKIDDLTDEKELFSARVNNLKSRIEIVSSENDGLKSQLEYTLQQDHENQLLKQAVSSSSVLIEGEEQGSDFACWGIEEDIEDSKNIKYEIPPGTLVKGIIVQGVSQPVGVGKPADPEVALIRITSAGKLPKKLRLALKGSNLICSTESILSNRRVRVRGETMSKHKKNGDFIVTDVSAVISGPGGKSGVPARVVSHGGVQAGYSAVAGGLGAAASTMQTVLNNQTIEKLSQIGPDKAILNSDVFTNIGLKGTNGGFDKITDYYLKMADLYCPVLEIDMGTEVSILFTSTVILGDKKLRSRLSEERGAYNEAYAN